MKILVTGAKGFVGRNLCAQLKNISEGKVPCYSDISIETIYEYDVDSNKEILEEACKCCDFVFNLAGVNRPHKQEDFMIGNYGFADVLLGTLKKYKSKAPVMLASSVQASLLGRFGNSEYGRSKRSGENLFLEYAIETGAKVLIYRFPNLFGKWCRPNYNSVIATFCYNIANNLPIRVDDPTVELELLYIDDLVDEMIDALRGKEHRCEFDGLSVVPNKIGKYCYCPIIHTVTLDEIVKLLNKFNEQPSTLLLPDIPSGSFAKKLYSTFLSYLPAARIAVPLKMNIDNRGSFTELLKTTNCGQFSVNISKPGIVKGQHWHNTKWEFFIVVSGKALIQQRRIDSNEILNFKVCSEKLEAIYMLPGYTHNIINLSETEDLVTLMWANEPLDVNKPDTYFLPIE